MTDPAPQSTEPPRRFIQTRTARMARARLARHLQGLGDDEGLWWRVQERVPEAWATVEEDIDSEEEKVKITLRLDASVAKLFRAMGKGYQARINHILATYAQMRMGEIDRQARDLSAVMSEFGVVQSEEARQTYLSLRDTEGLFDAESRSLLDAAFGLTRG
ncbi:BrnA antitoxin family protein [Defluviimonas sp. WL0050]|uniref:BrnA antitoxin family protein n=1 Tax=Albidovulum litorale TaxID=2984134 RepID=A0ABT2ZKI4_9RHOB|nr:BrnA antitoxin family protein [Defluviimonas sp. WL0050]MCV2871633.1 BrnA antitoxin family protein [Defluviimonas sp. WL0050]